ncbi:Kelch-like protein 7 [Chelonia mydas]|uniref:Kelch-like protein 7 n=1 Tax=Chelonia mydas TaxID=8469 RepID=M7AWK7_CHEMY|nr:Kelch-like protein 7 [Chelonia mydas]
MAASGSEKSNKKKTEKKLAAREEAKLLASFMGVMNTMRKQVYDAAVRWLKYDEPNRQPYMVDILAKVRFPLISKNFLSKTVQAEPLIQDNPECLKMVISGMRYHLLSPEDREELVEGTRPRRKKHDYRIALFGGSQPQSCRYFNPKSVSTAPAVCRLLASRVLSSVLFPGGTGCELRWLVSVSRRQVASGYMSPLLPTHRPFMCSPSRRPLPASPISADSVGAPGLEHPRGKIGRHYLFFIMQDYSWTDIRCPFEKRRDAACVFWDNVVYILGGSQLFPIKRMDCYNVVKDSWYSKLGPPTPRDSLAACAAEGKIYTSGGSEVGNSALYLFECYDTRTESWHTKPSMLTQRCSHGMVEANGLIYVCGGSLGNNVSGRVLNSCEVYDPATETWTELCPMIEARKNHGLVFVKDKIFAVGGQNGLGGLDNVEYYDIKMNEWKMVSPMPWKGVTVKCAAVGSIVYVLAGFQGVGRLGHILEYNTETDKGHGNDEFRDFRVRCGWLQGCPSRSGSPSASSTGRCWGSLGVGEGSGLGAELGVWGGSPEATGTFLQLLGGGTRGSARYPCSQDLICIWGEEAVQCQLRSSSRNYDTYGQISQCMIERGHDQDTLQRRVKVKELRNAYHKVREANRSSSAAPTSCWFYKELDVILNGNPAFAAKAPVDSSFARMPVDSGPNQEEEILDNGRGTRGRG